MQLIGKKCNRVYEFAASRLILLMLDGAIGEFTAVARRLRPTIFELLLLKSRLWGFDRSHGLNCSHTGQELLVAISPHGAMPGIFQPDSLDRGSGFFFVKIG
jgi:hypothetical protein